MTDAIALRIAVALERIADSLERKPRKFVRQIPTDGAPSVEASIDEWLDWWRFEKQAGRKVTLDQVSSMCGYSVDVLKKRSSKRRSA